MNYPMFYAAVPKPFETHTLKESMAFSDYKADLRSAVETVQHVKAFVHALDAHLSCVWLASDGLTPLVGAAIDAGIEAMASVTGAGEEALLARFASAALDVVAQRLASCDALINPGEDQRVWDALGTQPMRKFILDGLAIGVCFQLRPCGHAAPLQQVQQVRRHIARLVCGWEAIVLLSRFEQAFQEGVQVTAVLTTSPSA